MDNDVFFEVHDSDKVGLALSGGGFRASLFHLGVLYSLAEKDILRRVNLISTVSGGSIIGVIYYLFLKKELETSESTLGVNDYIKIVDNVRNTFMESINYNIRMNYLYHRINSRKRLVFKKRSKYMSKQDYYYKQGVERTKILGDVLDKYIYSKILNDNSTLKQLKINVKNEKNMQLIPHIIINTTCTNVGDLCRFSSQTNSYVMSIVNSISDKIDDFKYEDLRISDVVAASASVPSIFPSVIFSLNNSKYEYLELVDGGIVDNLGIKSLENEGCTKYIVSDGSKYFKHLTNRSFSSIFRTQDIFMDIIKKDSINKYSNTGSLVHMHLRCDLQNKDEQEKDVTEYGINTKIQDAISNIRTDIDTFSEIEALSLIYSGYKISNYELQHLKTVRSVKLPRSDYFNKGMKSENKEILRCLKIAEKRHFKNFRIRPVIKTIMYFPVVLLLIYLNLFYSSHFYDTYQINISWIKPLIWIESLTISAVNFVVLLILIIPLIKNIIAHENKSFIRFGRINDNKEYTETDEENG